MYGISVMSCVQNGYTGRQAAIAAGSGVQQKCIRISRSEMSNDMSGRRGSTTREGSSRESRRQADDVRPAVSRQVSGRRKNTVRSDRNRDRARTVSRGNSALLVRTVVLALVFAGMLAGFCMMTRASSREKEPVYKYYTTVTIGYGEDLSDIVFRYCDSSEYRTADDYVREICDINSIPYEKGKLPDLRAGTTIVIPYFDTQLK